MKSQDKWNLGISLTALFLSVATTAHDKISAARASARQAQRDVYDAYRLGQTSPVVFVYAKADHGGPLVNGQTQQQIAATETSQWEFAAQG